MMFEEKNKDVFNDLDSDCSEEIDEEVVAAQKREEERLRREAMILKCTEYDPLEIDSFDGVEDGYEEPTVIEEENTDDQQLEPEPELNEDDEEER
jgi:hypothetical protein